MESASDPPLHEGWLVDASVDDQSLNQGWLMSPTESELEWEDDDSMCLQTSKSAHLVKRVLSDAGLLREEDINPHRPCRTAIHIQSLTQEHKLKREFAEEMDEDCSPPLWVPMEMTKRAVFDCYMNEKYGWEAEEVLDQIRVPRRIPFQDPNDQGATSSATEQLCLRSKLRSDWILEREKERTRVLRADGVFRMKFEEVPESGFCAKRASSFKLSAKKWNFGRCTSSPARINIQHVGPVVIVTKAKIEQTGWANLPRYPLVLIARSMRSEKVELGNNETLSLGICCFRSRI